MELHEDWNVIRERLQGFILRRINDPQDAEDLLQDILIKMHGSLSDLRDHSRVQAWAYQMTRNGITDYYRQRAARTTRQTPLETPGALSSEHDTRDVERDLALCLRPMIDRLPDDYREALVMADLEGITQREVAERLGISLSGAKSRVQRGREKLRNMLHQCCTFELDRQGVVLEFRSRCDPGSRCRND